MVELVVSVVEVEGRGLPRLQDPITLGLQMEAIPRCLHLDTEGVRRD
jgi:hypothetical protein